MLAVILGITFTLLCSLRVAGDSSGVLGGNVVLRSVLKGPLWATQLARNVLILVLVHVALSALLGLLCWVFARLSQVAWPNAAVSRRKWVLCWFIVAAVWILVSNAAQYPWSSLGEPYALFVKASWHGINAYRVANIFAALAVTATMAFGLLRVARRGPGTRKLAVTAACVTVLTCLMAGVIVQLPYPSVAHASSAKPNVVVIGIDSLRTDVVQGGWGEVLTPNVDAFLKESTVFSDAITPLARTFPSWVATLSGKHPHTTGAIINLLPRDVIHTGETLPQTLRKAGYRTVYATDEVRFSNIDAPFGFDQVIAPPMGASDFLIGSLNDTPLSNLLVNTRLGQWLFPNLYANRGAAVTYDPTTFVKRFSRELRVGQPSFIAVHLTLPHWPYYWATAPSRSDNTGDEARSLYTTAVRRADEQFAGIVEALRRRGVLDDSVVIVMSDHGEAIGRPDDSPYTAAESGQRIAVLNGHGTSVLSPHQYHVVMALRAFGSAAAVIEPGRHIDAPVSLVDVAPTLLDLLKVRSVEHFDGLSLLPLLTPGSADTSGAALAQRVRFTESEFNPRGFQPGKTVTSSALEEAMSFYEIDPGNDRVSVKRDRIAKLLRERQYAAILGNRLLAAVPTGESAGFDFLLVDLDSHTYTRLDDRSSQETAEAVDLLSAMRARFGISISGPAGSIALSPVAARN